VIEEMLDLVDDAGNVLEVLPRSVVFAQKRNNFRLVIAVFVNHDRTKFLVGRRALSKKESPGALCHIGGCVEAGESYEDAFKREVMEESGIDVSRYEWRLMGHLNPTKHDSRGYVAVYELVVDPAQAIEWNREDFEDKQWYSHDELQQIIAQKSVLMAPNFPKPHIYFY